MIEEIQDREEIEEMENLDHVANEPFLTEHELHRRLVRNPLDLVISNHLDTLPKIPS